MPSKEGVGVCLHLPREGVPATVVKLEREQEREKGVEEGRGNSAGDVNRKKVPGTPSGGCALEKRNRKKNISI